MKKVSCVMPTADRHVFIPAAIKCFLDQEYYDDVELVIVDNGTVPCWRELPLGHLNIRYAYRPPITGKLTTGAMRNWGNEIATGDIIAHFDDDDWSHPRRLANQIGFHLAQHKPVTGYHTILYWREVDNTGFQYIDPSFRPHCAGTSLVYDRSYWLDNQFPDRAVGEDFIFCILANRAGKLASQDGGQMIIARAHDSNTCVPKFGSKKFPPVKATDFPPEFLLTLKPVQS